MYVQHLEVGLMEMWVWGNREHHLVRGHYYRNEAFLYRVDGERALITRDN